MTPLVTLIGRKLNGFGIFNELLSTQNVNETFSVIFKHREPLFSVITYVTPYFSKSGAHFVQNYDYHHLLL